MANIEDKLASLCVSPRSEIDDTVAYFFGNFEYQQDRDLERFIDRSDFIIDVVYELFRYKNGMLAFEEYVSCFREFLRHIIKNRDSDDMRSSYLRNKKARHKLFDTIFAIVEKNYESESLNTCLDDYFSCVNENYYPNRKEALEILEMQFFNSCRNDLDDYYLFFRKNWAGLKSLLKVKPQNKYYYDVIKTIMNRRIVNFFSDIDNKYHSFKRIAGNKDFNEINFDLIKYFFYFYRDEAPGKLNRVLNIISYGDVKSKGELEDCLNLKLNSYLPIAKIGDGGTRKVYKVLHTERDQIFALKIDKKDSEINHPRARKVINDLGSNEISKRERSALTDLTHENLARMWDFGSYDEGNYIVEDYVNGKTLEQLVKEKGKLSPREFILVFVPIFRAFRYLIDKDYIHRDIKPDNILVSDDFRIVKLTDLQNAVKVNDSGLYFGESFGSIRTMAPEVILENKSSFASDLYSLGVCMYYALTGEILYNYKSFLDARNEFIALDRHKHFNYVKRKLANIIPEYNIVEDIIKRDLFLPLPSMEFESAFTRFVREQLPCLMSLDINERHMFRESYNSFGTLEGFYRKLSNPKFTEVAKY